MASAILISSIISSTNPEALSNALSLVFGDLGDSKPLQESVPLEFTAGNTRTS